MDQSPKSEHSGRRAAFPRLRDMSHATVRRLSRPLSMVSGRSVSPASPAAAMAPERTPNRLKKTSTRNSVASRTSRAERPPSSRRTSLLSTAGSSVTRDEREPLGELPVFGVSQRAYLASLVSLFSSSTGPGRGALDTPLSANTPVTDPSSGAPSLGPYEYDIHSSAIYQYSKVRRLYVGWPGLVPPPPEALLEFEMETLPLLERDLQGISGYLGQQGVRITYELRMSGYASATADAVALSPTVWILYRGSSPSGAKVSVAELHQAVADIFYLQKGLEIQEGGGRIELTSDRGLVPVGLEPREGIELSDGGRLSIHIEDSQEKYSVCGALCCVTIEDGPKQVQSLCRIGGLLKINGKYILGVSTAHAMLDGSGIFRDSFDESLEARLPPGHAVDRDEILSESGRIAKWHNVTRDAAVDFLGISMNSRGEMAINRSKPENATDFSLLRLSKMPGYVRNKYIPPRSEEPVSITSTASASAAAMDEGPVHIICGGGDVAEGQLVWGSACFIVRGRNFRVRRIQTSRPLSAGITGAWVVRGEVLYGVIIAVYENEPFALMMTVERLFASILGSAFSIRSVELWDGVVPEALLKKVQEKGTPSKPSKNGTSDTPRRRANTETPDAGHDASSPKRIEIISGGGAPALPRPSHKSEGTQTAGPTPLLSTAEGATQTEEPCPPTTATAAQEEGAGSATSTIGEEPSSPSSTHRRRAQTRSESMASEASMMSGAVQDGIAPPAAAEEQKIRSDTGDSAVSTGAHTAYTTASETLQRQDSGFGSTAPPVRTPTSTSNEASNGTVRRGLQAPPIRPAENSSNNKNNKKKNKNKKNNKNSTNNRTMNLRGGVSSNEHHAASPDDDDDDNGDVGGDADSTPTKTTSHSRRSSLQRVFGKTLRRSSISKPPSQPNRDDDNHGIPPTGLNGRRPLFNRRRSSAIDPKPAPPSSRDGGASSHAPSRASERPLSSARKASAPSQEQPRPFTKDNNFGIPPRGLDDRRPLSFLRRTSAKASAEPTPEPATPNSNPNQDSGRASGSRSVGERPLSLIRRSKDKAPEEPEDFNKSNNFGIPHTGL